MPGAPLTLSVYSLGAVTFDLLGMYTQNSRYKPLPNPNFHFLFHLILHYNPEQKEVIGVTGGVQGLIGGLCEDTYPNQKRYMHISVYTHI